ncbi:MAG: MBL fold metallo-hydrolase [Fuerstiella sp.]|jgi:pyrroloquinoline quinone biosynthesis protein B|nr:MBL fold metallo-hydrolase [Fuerstiella sp.]
MRTLLQRVSEICLSCLICSPLIADEPEANAPYVTVLGIAQDAGFPQAGCRKECCRAAWNDDTLRQYATCLAIVDPQHGQRWLIDCTPDFRDQLRVLDRHSPTDSSPGLDGILLTHAHIGHYAGLIHLGREVMGSNAVPVHAMPRMRQFLEKNGPWEQLVRLNQIDIRGLAAGQTEKLNRRIEVTPFLVPHRDEYSETVGFSIQGPARTVIYIPDIDKWERWAVRIEDILAAADIAYLDGTFFANGELPGRDMSRIPHPFVVESLSRFRKLSAKDRNKVRFIHANHTNPILNPSSAASRIVKAAGHHVAEQGECFSF